MATTTRPQTDFRNPQPDDAPQWWLDLSELERGVVLTTMVVILIAGVLYGLGWSLTVVADFVPNVMTEILFFAATIVVIDRRNRQRSIQERKEELILQMGSSDNGFALEAVRLLGHYEYLYDGSLAWADLTVANLQGVVMKNANLQGVELGGANLQGAALLGVNLQGATLSWANLQGAFLLDVELQRANLCGADLRGTDLKGANLQWAFLWDATFDEKTTLPDGTMWSEDVDMGKFDVLESPEFWDPDWVEDDE